MSAVCDICLALVEHDLAKLAIDSLAVDNVSIKRGQYEARKVDLCHVHMTLLYKFLEGEIREMTAKESE